MPVFLFHFVLLNFYYAPTPDLARVIYYFTPYHEIARPGKRTPGFESRNVIFNHMYARAGIRTRINWLEANDTAIILPTLKRHLAVSFVNFPLCSGWRFLYCNPKEIAQSNIISEKLFNKVYERPGQDLNLRPPG